MTFSWIDLLTLAKSLEANPQTPGPEEAAQRCAVSRAYYAAFHHALIVGSQEGYSPHYSGEDHQAIQRHFRSFHSSDPGTAKLHKEVATQLNRLLNFRHKADYFNSLTSTPRALAASSIRMADTIISILNTL
jgi:uncharacterized protein (UPF0332 family)